jgi:hypothetical protein
MLELLIEGFHIFVSAIFPLRRELALVYDWPPGRRRGV